MALNWMLGDKYVNPYKLDYDPAHKIVTLTEKNRDFVEACIRIDSRYNTNWVRVVGKLQFSYSKATLEEIIKTINSTNNTRVQSGIISNIANDIFSKWDNLALLKIALGSAPGVQDLFTEIAKPRTYCAKATNRSVTRCDMSLASKVIVYLSKGLGCSAHGLFSKYDSKVSSCLDKYYGFYYPNSQKAAPIVKKPKTKKPLELWDYYANCYCRVLNDICSAANKKHRYTSGNQLNLEQLDHIIWYVNK